MSSPDIREMMEAQAEWISGLIAKRDVRRTVIKLSGEVTEAMEAVIVGTPKEVADEVGDILILTLDICKLYGIDPVEAFYDKLEINKNRQWRQVGGTLQHKE